MTRTHTRVLLVHPEFQPQSYWNPKSLCRAMGARHLAPPLSLITVAAMLPSDWDVRLIDRNVEGLTDADIDAADLVMTGGMLMQQPDLLNLIAWCQLRRTPVVVGGPDVTSSPHIYSQADFQVLGEAEPVIQQFIDAWNSGAQKGVFEAEKFTADVTQTPIPRFDLLRPRAYLSINVQFSRGCPFLCEFCDIIELYGRRPRTKSNGQMLAELTRLYDSGYRGHVDFVDDNLIGNKKAVKQFLPALAAWQRERGHPFELSTEASINIADDDELLGMMRAANFFALFVGIESPDPETLVFMQKKQNMRRDLVDSIRRINAAGMYVNAGFILGFDTERGRVAQPMIDFIEDAAIPFSVISLLYAMPNTQLTRRLQGEGRLHVGYDIAIDKGISDQMASGLNFDTVRPRRDILADYGRVIRAIYTPEAFFGRARRLGHVLSPPMHGYSPTWKWYGPELSRLGSLLWYIARKQPRMLPHFIRTIFHVARHNRAALKYVIYAASFYLHLGPFTRGLIEQIEDQIAEIDRGEWHQPARVPVKAAAVT